jgi:hypothetical protein
MQLGDTLKDISERQARGEAEPMAADKLPDGPGGAAISRETRSDMLYRALSDAEMSEDGMSAHDANKHWETACDQMLAQCDAMMAAVSKYSVAQQQALTRAFRAYVPQKHDDQTQEALEQTTALRKFSEAIEGALRAPVSAVVSEPRSHPMRGTPLPEVLHSGVLARKNAFGSLFKTKQKHGAGAAAPKPDGPRNFDLSRDVEQCDIFLSHSWGAPFETEAGALLAAHVL